MLATKRPADCEDGDSRMSKIRRAGSRILRTLSIKSSHLSSQQPSLEREVSSVIIKQPDQGFDTSYVRPRSPLRFYKHIDEMNGYPIEILKVEDPKAKLGPATTAAHVSPINLIRRVQSSPAIPHRVVAAFGASTVVRRTKQAEPLAPPFTNIEHEDDKSMRCEPFTTIGEQISHPSNGLLPSNQRQSTIGTSLPSSIPPAGSAQTQNNPNPLPVDLLVRGPLPTILESAQPTSIKELAPITPSVSLVEYVAAAKIYFETYYSQFGKPSSRSLRRRELEAHFNEVKRPFAEQKALVEAFCLAESDHLRQRRVMATTKLKDGGKAFTPAAAGYHTVRVLGKGSFGIVSLVRYRPVVRGANAKPHNGAVFAMKIINKTAMLRNAQEGHLRAERDLLVTAEHSRWIVPLVASFQDNDHLYLVMEFQIGGDFLNFLLNARHGIISEATAQWYIAEMILCVEEAHRLKWIHRDVKPDNFLISSSGHLKISDFGLAFDGHWAHNQAYYNEHRYSLLDKLGIKVNGDFEDINLEARRSDPTMRNTKDQFAWFTAISPYRSDMMRLRERKLCRSVVGTSQYMAPEVILGEWYDGRCDWWSIGIILYECLYGGTPFCRSNREKTKKAIANHHSNFRFPAHDPQPIGLDAKNLIYRLLQPKCSRISSPKYYKNDFRCDERGATVPASEHYKGSYDYSGRHVYPNDAEDIKRHAFFTGIPWEYMHLMRPPHVPRVKSEDSTRYFESEAEILADCSSDIVIVPEGATPAIAGVTMDGGMLSHIASKRPKKRPRDKLLRDPKYAKEVMEVRKKSAFLGYTWRRFSDIDYSELGIAK